MTERAHLLNVKKNILGHDWLLLVVPRIELLGVWITNIQKISRPVIRGNLIEELSLNYTRVSVVSTTV